MQTVRLNHAGAMIELPAETVINNWIKTLQENSTAKTVTFHGDTYTVDPGKLADELNKIIMRDYVAIQPINTSPTAIGTYWPEQAGIFIGFCPGQNGQPDYALIAPTDERALLTDVQWHAERINIACASSDWDGAANTLVMADGGSALAQHISALEIDGHKDFYLPARHELRMIKLVAPDLITTEWHWSSTQYSAHYAFSQTFDDGGQGSYGKTTKLRARAVRKIQISNLVIR